MTIKEIMDLGVVKVNSGDLEAGLNLINEAIYLDPLDPEKLHFRGLVYAGIQKPVEAIIDYKKAIQINPNVYQYHYNLGNVYMDFKQYQEAILCFTESANVNPSDFDIYANRGMCYLKLSQHKDAYNDFKLVLDSDHNNYVANIGMNRLLMIDPLISED